MRRKRQISRPSGRAESPGAAGFSNLLLAALPPEDIQRFRRALDVIPLPLKQFLHRPGDVIEYVYFPGGGFCSELAVLENGEMVEVATIGREGMVGIFAAKNGHVAPSVSVVKAASNICYRLPADVFRTELER